MEARINKILRECLAFIGIGLAVTLGWQLIEIYMIGEIVARDVDTVVALILTTSLYFNWKFYLQHNTSKNKD